MKRNTNIFIVAKAGAAAFLTMVFLVLYSSSVYAQMVGAGENANASYVITANGNLYAWGQGISGQLGNGNGTSSSTPVQITFPGTGYWVSVAGGSTFAVALGSDGNVYMWGTNGSGMGNGSATASLTPVVVTKPGGVTRWLSVSAGKSFCLALGDDGNVYGWGDDSKGQLGDNSTNSEVSPVMAQLPVGVKAMAIAAGLKHSLVIGNDGNLYGFGVNSNKQLESGAANPQTVPIALALPNGVTPVAIAVGGYYSAMLGSDGNIYTTGANDVGQCGTDSTTMALNSFTLFVKPSWVTSWKAVSCGQKNTLAITNDDSLYICGQGTYGQMGNGGVKDTNIVPNNVALPSGILTQSIACGYQHVLAFGSDGKIYAWGYNADGEIGNGTSGANQLTPAQVQLPTAPAPSTFVASGEYSFVSYFVNTSGNLFAWGKDNNGQVGDGGSSNVLAPAQITFPTGVTKWLSVSGGDGFTVALGNDGNIYAWGSNGNGLGDGVTTTSLTPIMVTKPIGVTGWTAVVAGRSFCQAISNDGNVYGWGANDKNQVNGTTTTPITSPVQVDLPGSATVTAIAAGVKYSIAINSNTGMLYGWGVNSNIQIFGGANPQKTPLDVTLPTGISPTAVAAGGYFTMILGNDGNIYEIGKNDFGQMGDGVNESGVVNNRITWDTLARPTGVTSWKAIAAGQDFALAIGNNDLLYVWGAGGAGQMGNGGTNSANYSPINVSLPSGVLPQSIAGGNQHILVLGNDGKVYAWGYNTDGEIGMGTSGSNQLIPVHVQFLTAPAAPILAAPTSGNILSSTDTAFVWHPVLTATSYNLQIASDSASFSNIVVDTTGIVDTLFIVSDSIKTKLSSVTKYFWRVRASNSMGAGVYSTIWSFIIANPTGVTSGKDNVPTVYSISQNYPNPFNPTTNISYTIPTSGFVSLKVYNTLGQEVATLFEGFQNVGLYKLDFDASKLASGIYLYRLQTNGFTQTKKMILMK